MKEKIYDILNRLLRNLNIMRRLFFMLKQYKHIETHMKSLDRLLIKVRDDVFEAR